MSYHLGTRPHIHCPCTRTPAPGCGEQVCACTASSEHNTIIVEYILNTAVATTCTLSLHGQILILIVFRPVSEVQQPSNMYIEWHLYSYHEHMLSLAEVQQLPNMYVYKQNSTLYGYVRRCVNPDMSSIVDLHSIMSHCLWSTVNVRVAN